MYLPQTNNQLRTSSNPRNQATIQNGRVVIQNVQGRLNRGHGNNTRGAGAACYRRAQNRVGNTNPGQARQVKYYNYNGIGHIARNCTHLKRPQNSEYFKDKMLLMQAQENRVSLDEEQLLFIVADDCDAFDFDVNEAPTAHTMFMANLSFADPVYDEAGPSYDSDILSEIHDHDHYQDAICEHHEEHEMHDDYVKDNAMPVVQSNVSYVPNDAYMMIFNDMHELHAQSVSVITQNNRLTEGERGFEQPKEGYLTEVIPFFKTLKEHFEGIQKALTKEIKEMKDIFEELEAEVDQNVVNRKHDEIESEKSLSMSKV
ncbi:hypothetical protein Tco_1114046 [Tanacetum coccineum]|uniref:Integrase, catalytic region, zinc finger, CCHC-type, peptidase aspartic, catalytic n=1 Tax=Tanacetum coccineum TaxID=301880 RepID=A0ABQ5IWY2_9ASTR